MPSIQIFDPALCCSTGICGVDVDQELVRFAADVDWARANGVAIERFNLSQQPMEFANRPAVKEALARHGQACLPLTLVEGAVQCTGRYPARDELMRWAGKAQDDSLSRDAIEELVAVGASVASNCEPCFRFHYDRARKLGASAQDIARVVAVAEAVKAAPASKMAELTQRYLKGESTPVSAVVPIPVAPAPSASCCPPSGSSEAPSTGGGCCG